jgi:hypothetical protein
VVTTVEEVNAMQVLLSFRPSSHSDNYTIVGKFETSEQSDQACQKIRKLIEETSMEGSKWDVDWNSEDASVSSWTKEVEVTVYTAGYTEPIEAILRAEGAKTIECFREMQTLTITVALPSRVNANLAALLLGHDDANAMGYLNDYCGKAEETTRDGVNMLVWHYRGDGIYDGDEDTLYLGDVALHLDEKKHWTVEEE